MTFKDFLSETFRTGVKLGLYPPLEDALGQYPPLYGTSKAADLITYIYLIYGDRGPDSEGGLVHYHDKDPRHQLVSKRK